MAAPSFCGKSIPTLTTCPADTAQIMLFNVPNTPDGVAMMNWSVARCCLISQIFGDGILAITGDQLDSQGRYYSDRLTQSVRVFSENIPNFINDPSQWSYIFDLNSRVIGIKILIAYLSSDIFMIFPNPTCQGAVTTDEQFSGLNETIYGSGVDEYEIAVTEERRLRFGNEFSIQVWIDNDGDGIYSLQTVPIIADVTPNPTKYTVYSLGNLSFKIILT